MQLGKALAATAVAALLASGLVSAGPSPGAEAARYKPYGSTRAPDQGLRPGCRGYDYRYRVTVPSNEWAAELFLVGPKGGGIASAAFASNSDPDAGRAQFRLCRPSVIAGRYKLKMKVTYSEGFDQFEGFVKPTFFRLERR